MPSFYAVNTLTPEQRARMPAALDTYQSVQRLNLERAVTAAPADAKDEMREFHTRYKHTPGPQSALLWRLLQGMPALEYPPPTRYGYPWYDVIEGPGPFPVMIHVAPDTAGVVFIDQCAWTIERTNEAGARFLGLMQVKSVAGSDDAEAESLRQRAEQAFRESPVIVVSRPHWGAFELYVGRAERAGRIDIVRDRLGVGSWDGTNPNIEHRSEGDPSWVRFTCDAWCIRRLPAAAAGAETTRLPESATT